MKKGKEFGDCGKGAGGWRERKGKGLSGGLFNVEEMRPLTEDETTAFFEKLAK
jgi:hypothetical protein